MRDSEADKARSLVERARRLVVLTGAGVSADSGVPTFRGEGGLWKRHRPEELATPGAFDRDPRLVWEWYAWRRERVLACEPNPAHHALADWCRRRPETCLVTQNVDGLHARAAEAVGAVDGRLVELHGSLFRVRCTACAYRAAHTDPVDATALDRLPRCPDCGALLRPAVVWFGEPLDGGALAEAFASASGADVCLVVGTSAVVHPAASIPLATLASGGIVVEVNPDATALTPRSEVSLRGRAALLLPGILRRTR